MQDEHPFFILRDSCYEALQMASSIHILLHILGPEGVVEIPHHGIDLLIFLLFKLEQEKYFQPVVSDALLGPGETDTMDRHDFLCYDREQNNSSAVWDYRYI